MKAALLFILCVVVSCSKGNPVSTDHTDPTPARPVVEQQTVKIALLSMTQGFDASNRWIVSGKIKNVHTSNLTGITIKASVYDSTNVLLASRDDSPSYGNILDLTPQGEVTFSITFYQSLHLNNKTPDATKTVLEILIDSVVVPYDNRSDLAYNRYFDFRFSNWGDYEETVASNEPGGFWLNHVAGGKATKISYGYARTTLQFSASVIDTVDVVYGFRGGMLYLGAYDFSRTTPTGRMTTINTVLTNRYGTGTSVEGLTGVTSWTKDTRTLVFLYPADTSRGIRIAYVDVNASLNTDPEDEYNRLPLRVIVSE